MFRRKKTFKNKIFASQRIMAILGVMILFFVLLPLSRNIKQRMEVDKEIKALKEDIAKIEGKNNDLKKMLSYLESEQFLEEQARLNFGLKKEGENVVVIDESASANQNVKPVSPNDVLFNIPGLSNDFQGNKETNIDRWFEYFLKNKIK